MADVHVFSPAPRKGNLVARLQRHRRAQADPAASPISTSSRRSREDWSTDPFKLVEQDGYFYARGSWDDKYMAASFVANLIRYSRKATSPTATSSWRWRPTRKFSTAMHWASSGC